MHCFPSFVPESPRWLLNKGRSDEAKDIILKMADVNKVDITLKDLGLLEADASGGKVWHLFTTRVPACSNFDHILQLVNSILNKKGKDNIF